MNLQLSVAHLTAVGVNQIEVTEGQVTMDIDLKKFKKILKNFSERINNKLVENSNVNN